MATTTTTTLNGFFTKTWTPAGQVTASVLFIHGFIEHIVRYDHVFNKFAEEGIAVFAFDQRGFGQTAVTAKSFGVTSWPLALGDISHFVAHASSLHPEVPLYLVGHSMGGGLSLGFSTRAPPSAGLEKIKGVIASAPLLRQPKAVRAPALLVGVGRLLGKVAPGFTMTAAVDPKAICRDPVIQEAYASDPLCRPTGTYRGVSDMLLNGESLMQKDYKNWPKDLPVLIVHGTGDTVTDCDASKTFVDQLVKEGVKDATFKSFDGFYHEMHNEPGDDKWLEIASLTSWIKNQSEKHSKI